MITDHKDTMITQLSVALNAMYAAAAAKGWGIDNPYLRSLMQAAEAAMLDPRAHGYLIGLERLGTVTVAPIEETK